jgi:hypothetical protein
MWDSFYLSTLRLIKLLSIGNSVVLISPPPLGNAKSGLLYLNVNYNFLPRFTLSSIVNSCKIYVYPRETRVEKSDHKNLRIKCTFYSNCRQRKLHGNKDRILWGESNNVENDASKKLWLWQILHHTYIHSTLILGEKCCATNGKWTMNMERQHVTRTCSQKRRERHFKK